LAQSLREIRKDTIIYNVAIVPGKSNRNVGARDNYLIVLRGRENRGGTRRHAGLARPAMQRARRRTDGERKHGEAWIPGLMIDPLKR